MKWKNILRSRTTVLLLFTLAALLLTGTAITGVRAAPLIESQFYTAGVEVYHIGIQLVENGNVVASDGERGELLQNLLNPGEELLPGKNYTEQLAVANNGSISEYVRVRVFRYWVDEQGNKLTDRDPSLIELHFLPENDWIMDESSSTPERTVLYYSYPIEAGAMSPLFADTLTISGKVATLVKQKTTVEEIEGVTYTRIQNQYEYDNLSFRVDVQVDGVQTHNAAAAILSAWGVQVGTTIDGGIYLEGGGA